MKKARARNGSKKTRSVSARRGSRKPADLAAIRQQITNLVGNGAVIMVETTMGEVQKGHYLAMKYLFEMIGLYPASGPGETSGEDSLAKTLLRRLRLPEVPGEENGVTKECEQDPLAAAGDGLE